LPDLISYANIILTKYWPLKGDKRSTSARDVQQGTTHPACHIQRVVNNPAYLTQNIANPSACSARNIANNPAYSTRNIAYPSAFFVQRYANNSACRVYPPAALNPHPHQTRRTITRMEDINYPVGAYLRGFKVFFTNSCLDEFFSLCGNDKWLVKRRYEQSHNKCARDCLRLYVFTHYIINKLICFLENYKFSDHMIRLQNIKKDYILNITALANLALADDFSKENSRFSVNNLSNKIDGVCVDDILCKISSNLTDLSVMDNAINFQMAKFLFLEAINDYLIKEFNIVLALEMIKTRFIHTYAHMLFDPREDLDKRYKNIFKYRSRHHVRSAGLNILSLCRQINTTPEDVLLSKVIDELLPPIAKKTGLNRSKSVPISSARNVAGLYRGNSSV